MAIAYHILAHKNPAQVERLLRVLEHPDDVFVLHFDRRAPRALHTLGREWARTRAQVRVQTSRTVEWGGPKISELQIEAMALALGHAQPWTHFINLTGQDFPLCTRAQRMARLEPDLEKSYLSWFAPLETDHWNNARERLDRWHLHAAWLQRALRLPGIGRRVRALLGWTNRIPYLTGYRRNWAGLFRYFGGSNYVVLARAACRYLTTDSDALRIRRWLSHSAHPDEIVFQSVLQSGPLAGTLVNKDWREIDFPRHSPHPRLFREADFDRLTASANLFARKFDESVDSEILDRLEAHLAKPVPSLRPTRLAADDSGR
jgi:Core-2/I-Branching enzyme